MTAFQLADILTYILVPIIGGGMVIGWNMNTKIQRMDVKINNIEGADKKTAQNISEINTKLDKLDKSMTRVCTKLEIQEVQLDE